MKLYWFRNLVQYFPPRDIPIHEIWCGTYVDVIEEWCQRYGNGHLEIRKMKIKDANLFNTVGWCIKKKQWLNPQYICASGNIDPKPGMSHYIPCLIAE